MLLNYELTNWACFADTVSFSMEAGAEHDPLKRVAWIGGKSRPLKVLPVAAIYGNNASGKTQFIASLEFLKLLITDQFKSKSLPVVPFALDPALKSAPTRFLIQFVIGAQIYELALELTSSAILRESLSSFKLRSVEKRLVYQREGNRVVVCNWGEEKFRDYALGMTLQSTKAFLSMAHIMESADAEIQAVYGWFDVTLTILRPTSRYMSVENYCDDKQISGRIADYLARFDTGIARFDTIDVPIENIDERSLAKVREELEEGSSVRCVIGSSVFVFSKDAEGIKARQLVAVHNRQDGSADTFTMDMESDGTKRMLDLVPAVCRLKDAAEAPVFVIDEIDRSMHHLVTRALVEDFLASCGRDNRAQLIFTTHDLLLMDQRLCRRDETWAADKSPEGRSVLTDFSSFSGLRSDMKLRDLYLEGRLGGVPRQVAEGR